MKKVIREVDEELGIVQVTIADERWYLFDEKDSNTDLPVISSVPSVTWICGFYPKGIEFMKWLASKGWDEAESIKVAAGDKGSKIHEAIQAINEGREVRIDSKFLNRSTGEEEELTLEECDAILSYVSWKNLCKPIQVIWEKTLRSRTHRIAGTLDYLYRLPADDAQTLRLLDFKSGQNIWTEYSLQVSAYKKMLLEMLDDREIVIDGLDLKQPVNVVLEILQVGYRRNKNGYKLTEVEDAWELFQAAQTIWASEQGNTVPKKKDYPIVLSPALSLEEVFPAPEKVVQIPPKKVRRTKEELDTNSVPDSQ